MAKKSKLDPVDKEMYKMSMLAEIAGLYYEQNLTQDEIGRRMCISRSRISRLLQEAVDKGIVTIHIDYNFERHYELESRFRDRFALKEVYILNNRNTGMTDISDLAAKTLCKKLRNDMIVGVTWGNTISSTINAMHFENPISIDVVQLMGSFAHVGALSSQQEIISKFSELSGGRPHFLNMPFLIKNQHVKDDLLEDINNKQTLQMGILCDMIITGVGVFDNTLDNKSWLGYMNTSYASEIADKGGVGSICGRFYDEDGKEIDCCWNRECIGISLDNLRKIDEVVCIISSRIKAPSIIPLLRSKTITTLILDSFTANAILELA